MSGFLPDIASWALRGGAGSNNNNHGSNNSNQNSTDEVPLTAEEMRAQRLARMEARQTGNRPPEPAIGEVDAMDVDEDSSEQISNNNKRPDDDNLQAQVAPVASSTTNSTLKPTALREARLDKMDITSTAGNTMKPAASNAVTSQQPNQPKKAKADNSVPRDANTAAAVKGGASATNKKMQRKKELLFKKVLAVALAGSTSAGDESVVTVDVNCNHQDITAQHIAELLATRLALDPSALTTTPPQKPLMAYLAQCHRRTSEELKTLRQQSSSPTAAASASHASSSSPQQELMDILEEVQRQVVSYAATCLIEPDLFEQAHDSVMQLAKCLISSVSEVSTSIVFGVQGSASSFYYLLCEELAQQDAGTLTRAVQEIAQYFGKLLAKCESVLDSTSISEGGESVSSIVLVSALTALCLHKRAAEAVTQLENFLLPEAGSAEANQIVRPNLPAGGNILQLLAGGENIPYRKRSGPALEKDTLLGLALRVGVPKSNAAFSPTAIIRQSLATIEQVTSQQRQQLKVHQEACNQLIMALIKAGPDVRSKVMSWFIDALNVNVAAAGLRPDPSKVSSSNLLLNMSVVLLKLCEPFVNDAKKLHLIDPGFVSSPADHGGVFAISGDNAVARLGENDASAMTDVYNPKNSFIPQCFFFCARSLHYGIMPLLSYHENLLRHISHLHWQITSSNRDIHSDPHFSILVSKERSNEVALFQESMVADTLAFCNLMARVLLEMNDDALKTMPEDFVSDVAGIFVYMAKLKGRLLRNVEVRYVFKLVVKLLSAKYAGMVRNYNLRATLGDVLHEIFLPSGDSRREVPATVPCDPMAGGQTYLLSDPMAQESLAPSLLLLYGEVEHTGYFDKMSHRAKISSLIKYLWESHEHRPAFRRITQNRDSFIKFANGIMNETNTLIATVMQKLPEIREAQELMRNAQEWARLSEDQQSVITSRLEDNEGDVKHSLPLCNKTMQMFGYLNTDPDIRSLFLLEELCPRLVTMLLHVLTKLVGSKGLDLKVDNPEQYEFRPKEMLRDLCAIFALFASSDVFQTECAKAGCDPKLLHSAVRTCRKLNLLTGESMIAFESLPGLVEAALERVQLDEAMLEGAPDEFLDELLSTFMKDPVILPSGHVVDRSTITQHLLNDSSDPFNRKSMTVNDIKPATELKERMLQWLQEKQRSGNQPSN